MKFKSHFVGLGLVAIGAAFPGCAVSTVEDSTQCRSQADCLAKGPEFADTTCTKARVCEKIAIVAASCTTNAECIDRNGGAAFTCRKSDSKCVSLTTPQCQT